MTNSARKTQCHCLNIEDFKGMTKKRCTDYKKVGEAERQRQLSERLCYDVPSYVQQLAEEFGVSEGTIRKDLGILETWNEAYSVGEKPKKWYATKPSNIPYMSYPLAYALTEARTVIKNLIPAEVYNEIVEVFEAANDVYTSGKNTNHQSQVERFSRATKGIDLNAYLVSDHISIDVLEPIKSAICTEQSVHIEVDNCDYYIEGITLFEIDNRLYVKGKEMGWQGKSMTFEAKDISAACIYNDLSFQRPRAA